MGQQELAGWVPAPVHTCLSECDGTQNFFRYRDRYFFPGPIFSGTGTGTFFRDQIFPVPVPVLFPGPIFSGTGTIQKGAKFPGPGIPGTGMSHSALYILYLFSSVSPLCHLAHPPAFGGCFKCNVGIS